MIGASRYNLVDTEGFPIGKKTTNVYLNGMLQMVGRHYKEIADANDTEKGIAIEFLSPTVFEVDDVIQVRWVR
ncbi:hypothetical protein D3C73_1523740 [compost metagenome]